MSWTAAQSVGATTVRMDLTRLIPVTRKVRRMVFATGHSTRERNVYEVQRGVLC